jgi:hypothetical protein
MVMVWHDLLDRNVDATSSSIDHKGTISKWLSDCGLAFDLMSWTSIISMR